MSHGWGATLMVIGLFLTLELIISNFIEPRLYGQSMGVSEIALLVSAAFWAFLWGPIGLVLSSPLTVCLVVLGRYSPQFEFLSVLLGDEPALDAEHQLLPAPAGPRPGRGGGPGHRADQGDRNRPSRSTTTMLLPALGAIKRNRLRGDITEDDERVRPAVHPGDRRGPGRAAGRRRQPATGGRGGLAAVGRATRSRSSAARPTTPRIAWPWRCSSNSSTRHDGASR